MKKNFTFSLPAELIEEAKKEAKTQNRTLSDFVRLALEKLLNNKGA